MGREQDEKDKYSGISKGELNFNLDEPDDSFVTGVTPPTPPPIKHSQRQDEELVNEEFIEDGDSDEDGQEQYQRGQEYYNDDKLSDEELLETLTEEEEHALEGVLPEEQADFIRALRKQSVSHQTAQWQEEEPNYYLTPEEQQMLEVEAQNQKTKKKLTTLIVSAVATLAIVGIVFVYFFTDIIRGEAEPEIPMYEEQMNELISLMYNAQGVDELASANPAILNYFHEDIKLQNDIRDSNVYAERYGYFFNAPTEVKVKELIQLESDIFIRYTIECELASPLTRIALVEINNEGKIIKFDEYNTY